MNKGLAVVLLVLAFCSSATGANPQSGSANAVAFQVPPLIFADNLWNATETNNSTDPIPCFTNLLTLAKSNGWYDVWKDYGGGPWIFFDYTWQATNLDAQGNIRWHPEYFPSGPANVAAAHAHGYRVILWTQDHAPYDSNAGIGLTNAAMVDAEFQFMATNWNVDGFWWDSDQIPPGTTGGKDAAINALLKVGRDIYLDIGVGRGDELDPEWYQRSTAVRPNMLGDPNNWSILTNTWNYIQTNQLYQYVRPGHFINMQIIGFWQRTPAEHESDMIMHAMMSSPFYYGYLMTASLPTNRMFLDILTDPAVIAAKRVLQTNGCDIYVKPLGSTLGPNYAVSVVNLSTNGAKVTLTLSNLLSTRVPTYSVDDVRSMESLGSSVSVQGVAVPPHASVMWRLSPSTDATTTAGVSSVMIWKQRFSYTTSGAGKTAKGKISGWTLMDADSLELAIVNVYPSRAKFSVDRPTVYSVSTVVDKRGKKLMVLAIQSRGVGSLILQGQDQSMTFYPSRNAWQIPKSIVAKGGSAYTDQDDFLTELTGALSYDKETCAEANSRNLDVSKSVDLLRSRLVGSGYTEETGFQR
jgi:hypothetical protein